MPLRVAQSGGGDQPGSAGPGAGWYRRNARRVGLQTPVRSYLITVAVLTGLALAIPR